MIFRLLYDVVGSGEPEYYPIEIITTIVIILSIVLSYLIYYEHKKTTGEKELVYILLLILFCTYYLAENNWLQGREFREGTVAYGIFAFIVFILVLRRVFYMNKTIFYLFLIGVICLALGTFIDAMNDNVLPFTFNQPRRILLEEIPEVFASILFLHSLLLLYKQITHDKCWFVLDRAGTAIIIISSLIIGYGNTYLLQDHGRTIPFIRIIIGIIIWIIGFFMPLAYFMYYRYKARERYWKRN